MKQILLLAAFFLFSCNQGNRMQREDTVITGQMVNRPENAPEVITVIECNPLGEDDRYAVRLDSTGKFAARLSLLWGHSFTISYGRRFINVYADRGDSIHLEIDADKLLNNMNKAISFSGDNAKVNAEFSEAFFRLGDLANRVKLAADTVPLTVFMTVYEKEYKRLQDSLEVYCKLNPMGEKARFLMDRMFLYSIANYCLDYEGTGREDALGFFCHPLLDINNPDNLQVMMFPYHLYAYINQIIQLDTAAMAYAREQNAELLTKRGVELLSELPEGLYRDVMLYKFFSNMNEYGGMVLPDSVSFGNKDVYRLAYGLFVQKGLSASLPEINVKGDVLYYNQTGKTEAVPTGDFCKYLKDKYKGKIIYLDIWATWCGPCRAEMKPAKELHTLYHDREVVFVNVCMKSGEEKWLELVMSNEVEGENYFLNADVSDIAMDVLQVGGFPTYLIINRSGEIINRNPPRPSAISQLSGVLDELLKKE